ncbi:hypothetical protein ACHHYP_03838 [Achlya hypogyna]|uniref:Uncharacterized protein n=1 Tax=Achlya hypogyna TaxID=1202772 RepID=A0A1V9Z2U7_ACHHY|nr:hypothetical protein ACHHYP_03838 [Achlya hypogyna]
MSSGYEWAMSAEAFLAATSGRRGYSTASFYAPQPAEPPQSYMQQSTPPSNSDYDMEVCVADPNGPMVQLVMKRKLCDDEQTMLFKRQRVQCTFVTLGDDDETMDIIQELMFRKPYKLRLPTPLVTMQREKDLSTISEEEGSASEDDEEF